MRLVWSARARGDLREIRAYSVGNWGSRIAAAYLVSLRDAAQLAARNPKRARLVRGRVRYLRIRSHYLLLIVDPDAGRVTIARVLHERMDIERHLPDPGAG
jgi:plasmid stabilization system protein ParE